MSICVIQPPPNWGHYRTAATYFFIRVRYRKLCGNLAVQVTFVQYQKCSVLNKVVNYDIIVLSSLILIKKTKTRRVINHLETPRV